MICPLVFELPDVELQRVYHGIVKEHATRKFSKELGATYTGNAYDYKRKKRVRHKTITYYDRITGRQRKARCVFLEL